MYRKKDKDYQIKIFRNLIYALFNNQDKFFISAICHEFQHIIDYQLSIACPYTKYEVNTHYYNSKEEFLVKMGLNFWTEVRAYTESFYKSYKYDRDNKTFYQYILDLQDIFNRGREIYFMEKNTTAKIYCDFKKKIDDFVYSITKYFAFLLLTEK